MPVPSVVQFYWPFDANLQMQVCLMLRISATKELMYEYRIVKILALTALKRSNWMRKKERKLQVRRTLG